MTTPNLRRVMIERERKAYNKALEDAEEVAIKWVSRREIDIDDLRELKKGDRK